MECWDQAAENRPRYTVTRHSTRTRLRGVGSLPSSELSVLGQSLIPGQLDGFVFGRVRVWSGKALPT